LCFSFGFPIDLIPWHLTRTQPEVSGRLGMTQRLKNAKGVSSGSAFCINIKENGALDVGNEDFATAHGIHFGS
jgi:hypothetical protein